MKVIIATPNIYKQKELNKYFENIRKEIVMGDW